MKANQFTMRGLLLLITALAFYFWRLGEMMLPLAILALTYAGAWGGLAIGSRLHRPFLGIVCGISLTLVVGGILLVILFAQLEYNGWHLP